MKRQSQTGWLSKQRQQRIFSLPRCVRKAKAQKLVRKNYKESKLAGSPVALAGFHLNITGKHDDSRLDYAIVRQSRSPSKIISNSRWTSVLSKDTFSTLHTWQRKTTLPMVTHLYSNPPQRNHKPSVTVLIFTFSPKHSSCSGFAVNISTQEDLDAPIRSKPSCTLAH